MTRKKETKKEQLPLRLNLACGRNKAEGFVNVDIRKEVKPDLTLDLLDKKWPWKDNSVDYVACINFFNLVPTNKRSFFMNELWRILKVNKDSNAQGAKAEIIVPHPWSTKAFQHPDTQFPHIVDSSFDIYNLKYRKDQDIERPGLESNFKRIVAIGGLHPDYTGRNDEFVIKETTHQINVVENLVVNLFKLPKGVEEN